MICSTLHLPKASFGAVEGEVRLVETAVASDL